MESRGQRPATTLATCPPQPHCDLLTHGPPSPRCPPGTLRTTHLHGVGERHEAQAADVQEDRVEQGPDDVVGHRGLAAYVDHGGRHGGRRLGRPQHGHLVLLLEHLVGRGDAGVRAAEERLGAAVHGASTARRGPDAERCSWPSPCLPQEFRFLQFPFLGLRIGNWLGRRRAGQRAECRVTFGKVGGGPSGTRGGAPGRAPGAASSLRTHLL